MLQLISKSVIKAQTAFEPEEAMDPDNDLEYEDFPSSSGTTQADTDAPSETETDDSKHSVN
jgi:hypothetical protein